MLRPRTWAECYATLCPGTDDDSDDDTDDDDTDDDNDHKNDSYTAAGAAPDASVPCSLFIYRFR